MRSVLASSVASLALAGILFASAVPPETPQERTARVPAVALDPTSHSPVPEDPRELWLVPDGDAGKTGQAGALLKIAEGITKFAEQDFAGALARLTATGVGSTPLADYATYYAGLAHLRSNDVERGRQTLSALKSRPLHGYLAHAAVMARAEAAEAAGDAAAAIELYRELEARTPPIEPQVVLHRLGRALATLGKREEAAAAFLRVRYEYPLSEEAALADAELAQLGDVEPKPNTASTFKLELGRAERLFTSRRYAAARDAFQVLRPLSSPPERELIELRLAECDFYLRRYAAARDGLRPFLTDSPRAAEAQYFYLAAIRELGQHEEYLSRVRGLVREYPESSWAEEALNNLGTHHILENDDGAAAEAFKELLERFPNGSRAERASWKAGWWEYKNGNHAETVKVFEAAAARFPRSDYRPSWVYWAARARERLGDTSIAADRYRLVTDDYLNTYYGRLAARRLARLDAVARTAYSANPPEQTAARPSGVSAAAQDTSAARAAVPTADLIRLLLSVGLEADAINELQYAQRAWGSSPVIDATLAWAYARQGDLRRAINLMKRAYPQHMTAERGARLPDELLRVIFPLDYWSSIQKYSRARKLDPYVVAALVAQESTFDPQIRSAANAYGLMQVVPGTGRRLARSLGVRYRGVSTLTNPDVNLRMGTLYFSRLIAQFGGVHLALAAYNAGESRIVRWVAERPGLERDEFIDDIPFPETQNYVKKILGTAEDYRALYKDRSTSGPAARKPAGEKTRSSRSSGTAATRRQPR